MRLWPFSAWQRRRSLARLKAECERLNRADLPWRLGYPDANGLWNFRGVHSDTGYTVDVLDAKEHVWEWAEIARQYAKQQMVHLSGVVEIQGPFAMSPGVDRTCLLLIPRLFRAPAQTRKWLASCGIYGGDVGASEGSGGGRAAANRPR